MSGGAAVFDFDRTLVHQETMALYLRTIAGRRAYWSACLMASLRAASVAPAQRLITFRREILRRTLAGKTVQQATAAAEALFPRLTWIEPIVTELHQHKDAGRHILVATGSLSVYMPTLLARKGIPADTLFATEMQVQDGILTGEMATLSCTWAEKARRVDAWRHAISGPLWGYGNMPPDEAMLKLTDHPTVVPI
jgi:HAD superfamily phosphoserine phosphatase-like hydrolase